jgi:hypothetical protein
VKGLVLGGTLFAVLCVFFVFFVFESTPHKRQGGSLRSQQGQAVLASNIAAALARSGMYRVMVTQYYAEHGYFPSHIDELDPGGQDTGSTAEDSAHTSDIEIANFGDVVLRIRDSDGQALGVVTLTGVDDDRLHQVSWECHTADFEEIQTYFPQCQYRAEQP